MGYEDLALRLLSAQRFFIISDNRFLPAAVRRRPRRAAEPWPFPAVWHDTATPQTRSLCEPIRILIEMETVGRFRHAR
jgi:hypothetical protein